MLKKSLKITIFIIILIILICTILNFLKLLEKDEIISVSEQNEIKENVISIEISKNENNAIESRNQVLEIPQEKTDTTSIQEVNKNIEINTKTNNKVITRVEKQQESSTKQTEVIKNKVKKNEIPKSNEQTIKEIEEKPKVEEIVDKKQEETKTPSINTENNIEKENSEELKDEIKEEKKNIESFKVNNSMIEKIKTIIDNNSSSTMQQFGYNIVVDSSIVNQTTGFTFTETRVKNAVKLSFGTIKIYARDYYVDDELIWIECFIL